MKHRFPTTLSALGLLAVALPAQHMGSENRDAPRLTQTFAAGRDLDFTLEYTAITWAKGEQMATLLDASAGGEARKRMNSTAAGKPLGTLRAKHALTLGGQRVERGTYDVFFNLDDEVRWHLRLGRKGQADQVVDLPLETTVTEHAKRLQMTLVCADAPTSARLGITFGAMHAALDVGPAPRPVSDDNALTAIREFIAGQAVDTGTDGWRASLAMPPKLEFSDGKTYYWHLETNKGPIKIKLLHDVAPMHVSSTIYLSELGYYDTLKFHRVIQGFMAQGGCPFGTGTGGPGYEYDGEFDDSVKHDRPGLLSMANRGPRTDGSQFFLTFVPTSHLDGRHTIFGEVADGMSTVKTLEKFGSQSGQTTTPLLIEQAYITVE